MSMFRSSGKYSLYTGWRSKSLSFRIMLLLLVSFVLLNLTVAYYMVGSASLNRSLSANAARAQTLKADIAALPAIDSVRPSQTSGLLDHALTTRKILHDRLRSGAYSPASPSFIYAPLSSFDKFSRPDHRLHDQIHQTERTLEQNIHDLSTLKKSVEYTPAADLAQDFDTATDTQERLRRTQQGLMHTKEYISASTLPDKQALLTDLGVLISKSTTVNEKTKTAWASDILRFQTILLHSLAQSDIQQTGYAKNLDTITQAYQ